MQNIAVAFWRAPQLYYIQGVPSRVRRVDGTGDASRELPRNCAIRHKPTERKTVSAATKQVLFFHDYPRLELPRKSVLEAAERIIKEEKVPESRTINVVFCSDYKIRKLNRQYREMDKSTDVLSFSFGDDDLLGEIYISLQRANVQSRRFGLTYEEEVVRLFVHGFLHLLGYRHKGAEERTIMEAREEHYDAR